MSKRIVKHVSALLKTDAGKDSPVWILGEDISPGDLVEIKAFNCDHWKGRINTVNPARSGKKASAYVTYLGKIPECKPRESNVEPGEVRVLSSDDLTTITVTVTDPAGGNGSNPIDVPVVLDGP